jgi:hypothetical protein
MLVIDNMHSSASKYYKTLKKYNNIVLRCDCALASNLLSRVHVVVTKFRT